jgi:hypothetical protein
MTSASRIIRSIAGQLDLKGLGILSKGDSYRDKAGKHEASAAVPSEAKGAALALERLGRSG